MTMCFCPGWHDAVSNYGTLLPSGRPWSIHAPLSFMELAGLGMIVILVYQMWILVSSFIMERKHMEAGQENSKTW